MSENSAVRSWRVVIAVAASLATVGCGDAAVGSWAIARWRIDSVFTDCDRATHSVRHDAKDVGSIVFDDDGGVFVGLNQQPDVARVSDDPSPFAASDPTPLAGSWARVDAAIVIDGTALSGTWQSSEAGLSADHFEVSSSPLASILEPCGTEEVTSTLQLTRAGAKGL